MARTKQPRTFRTVMREPTTWAGLFSIGAAVATGGASLLTDPVFLTKVGAGLALVLAKEGS